MEVAHVCTVYLGTVGPEAEQLPLGFRGGLECIAQGRSVIVPAGSISQIVECEVVPLPLSRAHVSGIGVHDHQIVVVLRLFDKSPPIDNERRNVTAALLRTSYRGALFALEVTRVVSLISAQPIAAVGPWVMRVSTPDGRTLPWLLVDRVLAELGVIEADS
jgi:hypothetical protein